MKTILLCTLMAVVVSVNAQECESEGNMDAVRACLEIKSSASVDVAYSSLISVLDNLQEMEAMKEAQNDWSAFRDSTCHYAALTYLQQDYGYAGDARTNCKSEFNSARIKMLNLYKRRALENQK